MTETPVLIVSPNIRVCLDGIPQTRVTSFNTRGGRLTRYVQNDEGEWVLEECRGLVTADCDFAQKTTQAFGSGEGTNSTST